MKSLFPTSISLTSTNCVHVTSPTGKQCLPVSQCLLFPPLQTDSYLGWGRGSGFFFFPFIAIFQGFHSLVILSPQIISGLWQRSRYNTDLECWMKGLFLVQPEENNWSPSYSFLPHHNGCSVGCFTFARSWLIANVSIWYLHAYSELCIC